MKGEVIIVKRILIFLTLIFLLPLMTTGCSSLVNAFKQELQPQEQTNSTPSKPKWKIQQERALKNARKIQFGTWPKNSDQKELDRPRNVFDPREKITFLIEDENTFNTDTLTIRLVKQFKNGKERFVEGWEEYITSDYVWYRNEFYPAKTTTLEPGQYMLKIYRGLELHSHGSFKIVEGYLEASHKQKLLKLPDYIEVEFEGEQIKLNVPEPLLFDYNKSDLTQDSQKTLNDIAVVLKEYPNSTVQINGHTDSKGSDQYNLELSNKRANVVMNYLKQKSPSTIKFEPKGFGEIQPIASNDTLDGRQKNRRVEIVIISNE